MSKTIDGLIVKYDAVVRELQERIKETEDLHDKVILNNRVLIYENAIHDLMELQYESHRN